MSAPSFSSSIFMLIRLWLIASLLSLHQRLIDVAAGCDGYDGCSRLLMASEDDARITIPQFSSFFASCIREMMPSIDAHLLPPDLKGLLCSRTTEGADRDGRRRTGCSAAEEARVPWSVMRVTRGVEWRELDRSLAHSTLVRRKAQSDCSCRSEHLVNTLSRHACVQRLWIPSLFPLLQRFLEHE